jgi:hypothetical protein
VALTLRQIQQPLHGTYFSRQRSSCSSTGMASFSKDRGSSLAFAWGLQKRQTAAARVESQSTARWQRAQCGYVLARSISINCECGGWKTLRVSVSMYKSPGGSATARWICFKQLTQQRPPGISTSSSRCALSRGLGYIYSIPWVATIFKRNSGHILHSR